MESDGSLDFQSRLLAEFKNQNSFHSSASN